jgi:uncharacterized membrane protein YfcA
MPDHILLLLGAGLLAGGMNAVAGGGTFVTLPALVFAGIPAVAANASSTIALFPGTVASTYAYRRNIAAIPGLSLPVLLAISVAGGLIGALLLLFTPSASFDRIVPWMLLLGTVVFAFGRKIGDVLRRHVRIGRATVAVVQFLLAIYGGYFGAGVGIMMLATWSLFGLTDIKALSGIRTFLVSACNGVAVICFAFSSLVWWPQTLVVMAAAVAGGLLGAQLVRRVPTPPLRMGIAIFNALMTALVFWKVFFVSTLPPG